LFNIMSCKVDNKSAENVMHEALNAKTAYKTNSINTAADVVAEIDRVASKLFVTLNKDGERVYALKDNSDLFYRKTVTRIVSKFKKFDERSNYYLEAGTIIHNYATEFVRLFHANDTAAIAKMREEYLKGTYFPDKTYVVKFKFTDKQLNEIEKFGKLFLKEAQLYQDVVNSQLGTKDKFELVVETPLVNNTENYVGTPDLLVIFSNRQAKLFDIKTNSTKGGISRQTMSKYHSQLMLLKKSMTTQLKLDVIETRVIPLYLTFDIPKNSTTPKDVLKRLKFNSIVGEIPESISNFKAGKYDTLGIKGVDDWIRSQYTLLKDIRKRAGKKGLSFDQKKEIFDRAHNLEESISAFIQTSDFEAIKSYVDNYLLPNIAVMTKESFDPDKTTEEAYLDDVNSLLQELELYSQLLDKFKHFDILDQNNPLLAVLGDIQQRSLVAAETLKIERDRILLESISNNRKKIIVDDEGREKVVLNPVNKLGVLDRIWTRVHSIDHPVFKVFFKKKENITIDREIKVQEFTNNYFDLAKKALNFLSAQGKKFEEVFIDLEGSPDEGDPNYNSNYGNFIKTYSKEGYEKIKEVKKAAKKKRTVLKEIYDVKEGWDKKYAEYRQRQFEKFLMYFSEEEAEKKIMDWDTDNGFTGFVEGKDFWSYSDIMNGTYATRYVLSLNNDFKANYKSQNTKYIESNPELNNFFNGAKKYIKEALDMYEVSGESVKNKINFFPRISKSAFEYFKDNGYSLSAGKEYYLESLANQSENNRSVTIDEEGQVTKVIPKLFLNNLKADELSFNILESISLFYKSASEYEASKKLEVYTLGLKQVLADTPVNFRTPSGNAVTDFMQNKVDTLTDKGDFVTYSSFFDDLVDKYVYGISTQGTDFEINILGKKVPLKTISNKLTAFERTRNLGLNIPSAVGASLAAYASKLTQGAKGLFFDQSQAKSYFTEAISNRAEWGKKRAVFSPQLNNAIDSAIFKNKAWWKKLADDNFLLSPFSAPDQELLNQVSYAMSKNYGLDSEGNIRILKKLPKGTKSLFDSLIVDVEGNNPKVYFEGYTPEQSARIQQQFFTVAKTAFYRVTGTVNKEDVYGAQMHFLGQMLMTYKTWMPGVIGERFGDTKYDDITDTIHVGRYRALASSLDAKQEKELKRRMASISLRASQLLLDASGLLQIATFNTVKSSFKSQEIEINGVKINARRLNIEMLQKKYEKYIADNPDTADRISLQEFIDAHEGQLKAMVAELRVLLTFMLLVSSMALGSDDEDDVLSYKHGYVQRMTYKMITKGVSELQFFYNPTNMITLVDNPIPVLRFGTSVVKSFNNTIDETRDLVVGEDYKGFIDWKEDPNDKTPVGYETTKFIKGFNGMRKIIDTIYEGDERIQTRR
jgi:hypothetical protein